MTGEISVDAYDYALVGGGLQNGLMALAILHRNPEARIALIERREELGGNHIWCFHSDDVDESARSFVEPLVAHRWPGYEVRFPRHSRDLDAPYAAVTCQQLDDVVARRLASTPGCDLILGHEARDIGAREVTLGDGRRIAARAVIDSRGPRARYPAGTTGFQKFVGHELVLAEPHGMAQPVLMDATVEQGEEGYRFFYVLPLADDRVLVEETFFSDTPHLALDALRGSIARYAESRGLAVRHVQREESGVLPIPWQGEVPIPAMEGPLVAGYAGGWFHPGTGYSFPIAVRLADYVSQTPIDELFGQGLRDLARAHQRQARYCHVLNKMFFAWFPPHQRYNVMERFYRLPEGTIRRFYALSLTGGDRARIVMGRPPKGISLRMALRGRKMALAERGAL